MNDETLDRRMIHPTLRCAPAARVGRWAGVFAAMSLIMPALHAEVQPAGRVGRAIIVAMAPKAVARHPDKTAHDYPKGQLELREGMALSELHTVETDKDGRLCMALTPGALVCVRPSTSFKIDRLEQVTDGLPEKGKDLLRRMEFTMTRGAVLVHAGVPSPNTTIRVTLPGGTVEANGGEFVMTEDQGAWLVGAYRNGLTVAEDGGARVAMDEGKTLRIKRDASGKVVSEFVNVEVDQLVSRFDMCLEFFADLEKYVFHPFGVDTGGLESWIGEGPVAMAGDPTLWTDVTPSIRLSPPPTVSGARAAPASQPEGRWTRERVWEWYRGVGVIRGVNYLPRTSVNTVEFWQSDTFDTNAINEELEWARESGFNAVRVTLQQAVWTQDPKGFRERFDTFLDLARRHRLYVVPVLFDDQNLAGRSPAVGKQPEPVPGIHNSQWVPSPGPDAVQDRAKWGGLEDYVRDMVGGFRRDKRILFWDLYNDPGAGGLGEKSVALLDSTFRWVRQERPVQPVTAAVWGDGGDPVSARLMELSDLVTFHAFDAAPVFQARMRACEAAQRPVLCTDWLKRQAGNTFKDILPLLADKNVGWFSRGLVKGRAQFFVPEESKGGAGEPTLWQQDVLQPDGKPYDRKEIELIKAFQFSK